MKSLRIAAHYDPQMPWWMTRALKNRNRPQKPCNRRSRQPNCSYTKI